MNGKTLYRTVRDGNIRANAIAEAAWEIACRDDVREAWEAVRPGDTRRIHALQVIHAALRTPDSINDRSLVALDEVLGLSVDDLRRWQGGDRFVCERGTAALLAARYALRVVLFTRRGNPEQAALAVCASTRYAAEAAIEPVEAVRDELMTRAERIACEPDVAEWQAWMATGGEG